jgi:serine/threonine protein kinase
MEQDAMEFTEQILSAVAYCHLKNICHRDIKGENFLVVKKQGGKH